MINKSKKNDSNGTLLYVHVQFLLLIFIAWYKSDDTNGMHSCWQSFLFIPCLYFRKSNKIPEEDEEDLKDSTEEEVGRLDSQR